VGEGKRMSWQQDEETTHFIYRQMMHHTAQLSGYDAANRMRRTRDFLEQSVDEEEDANAALEKRIKALEAELADGEAILDWHARRREVCHRLHNEALKAAGVEQGIRDPDVCQRLNVLWSEVRKDETWKQRRTGLTNGRLARLRAPKPTAT
jgi:hypothetical protein